jgi:hypothetical protein
MKKTHLLFATILSIFPRLVFGAAETLSNPTRVNTLQDFIKEILSIVVKVGVPVAVVFLIWSGFLFVTAQGDETQLKKARWSFLGTSIGVAVLLGSWLLASIIKSTVDQL